LFGKIAVILSNNDVAVAFVTVKASGSIRVLPEMVKMGMNSVIF